jgi:23S rRNA pseudouridine1911/1915/1917 synthase
MRADARARLETAGVSVLFEDNHVLAVAKPAGLASQGGPDVGEHLVLVLERYRREAEGKPGRAFVGIVHRLDRNVSGVLVVAKTSKAARRLADAMRARGPDVEKRYLAWVAGRPEPPEAALEHLLTREARKTRLARAGEPARAARLSYRTAGAGPRAARLEVLLGTGVTHQIRAQLSLVGHPLLGDSKYGGPPGPRPALHAASLVVPHPVTKAPLRLEAPVPDDLRRLDRAEGIVPPLPPEGQGA